MRHVRHAPLTGGALPARRSPAAPAPRTCPRTVRLILLVAVPLLLLAHAGSMVLAQK
jgi:hypothetical protein